jgi:threonine/homoserine/homoserine lactone efflux protein
MLFILGRASDSLLLAIQIIGGLYLLYLAYVTVRVLRKPLSDSTAHTDSGQRTLFQATLTNLLNPNSYLFWGTVGVQTLVQGWREGPINGVSFLLGFYVVLIGGLAATIMLFGLAGGLEPRIRFALNALAAIILLSQVQRFCQHMPDCL